MPENFRHSRISGNNLEDRIQGVLRGIDVEMDIGNIELCHCLKENRNKRKFVVNISKRKGAGKIKVNNKKLQTMIDLKKFGCHLVRS